MSLRSTCWVLILVAAVSSAEEYKNDLRERYGRGYGETWMFFPDGNNTPSVTFLTEPDFKKETRKSDEDTITFQLYTRQLPKEGIPLIVPKEVTAEPPASWLPVLDAFDSKKQTKFIVHGWKSAGHDAFATEMRDAYLKDRDCNVIVVDWHDLAGNPFYLMSMGDTKKVGKKLAKLIDILVSELETDKSLIHIIGHSLGAHASGFAGSMVTVGKISRITGLDPALPGFRVFNSPDRTLDATDADFVDVIHSCGGVLGYLDPIGVVDFYPNGGTPSQPGCCCVLPEVLEACSHARSYNYYIESISSHEFISQRCDNWQKFESGECKSGDKVIMGDAVPKDSKGSYFLRTAAQRPFAMGDPTVNEIPRE